MFSINQAKNIFKDNPNVVFAGHCHGLGCYFYHKDNIYYADFEDGKINLHEEYDNSDKFLELIVFSRGMHTIVGKKIESIFSTRWIGGNYPKWATAITTSSDNIAYHVCSLSAYRSAKLNMETRASEKKVHGRDSNNLILDLRFPSLQEYHKNIFDIFKKGTVVKMDFKEFMK